MRCTRLRVERTRDCFAQPVETLVQPLTRRCNTRLDARRVLGHVCQLESLAELVGRQRVRLVLFVGVHEQLGLRELVGLKDQVQSLFGLVNAGHVGSIDDKDDGGGVGVVAAPVGADRGLAAEIPDVEVEVFVGYGFDVEADCRDRGDDLTDLG